ncbi:hypothetical protein PoB_006577500 [Plakobranchus ocellatus]|uniref:Uncharacterized protein n=1 Tax=Plakobranchus ocellatus TaxID=259542 RepID=A0AAV4D5J2_9GAST|nr:hypothetical protein PoB_006577500 [Plakobranchus ocellatus]
MRKPHFLSKLYVRDLDSGGADAGEHAWTSPGRASSFCREFEPATNAQANDDKKKSLRSANTYRAMTFNSLISPTPLCTSCTFQKSGPSKFFMANYLTMPYAKNNQDPTPGSSMLGLSVGLYFTVRNTHVRIGIFNLSNLPFWPLYDLKLLWDLGALGTFRGVEGTCRVQGEWAKP